MYSYERMLQRQNEAARMRMNNIDSNQQQHRRMFQKREAEGSFEYDVIAEHSADNNNRQMMMIAHPNQQTSYRMNQIDNNRFDTRMNQMNNRMDQHNMDNRMNQRSQHNMDNQMDQYNMDQTRMDQTRMNQMNRNQMMNNR